MDFLRQKLRKRFLSTPSQDDKQKSAECRHCDVVVIGSGLSGLTTAYRLARLDVSVILVEASDYLGGRTRSIKLDTGDVVSVGGTWCMFDDEDILGLAEELRNELGKDDCFPFTPSFEINAEGLQRLIHHPYLLLKLWLLGRKFSKDGKEYWNDSEAKKYDCLSLFQWLENQTGLLSNEESRLAVRDWFYLMETEPLDLRQMSTLFAAIMVYQRLSNITQTGLLIPKCMRWEGGTGVFIEFLLEALQRTGKVQMLIQTQVKTITQTSDQVIVETSGETITCRYAVVATSPLAASFLKYDPPLPMGAQRICEAIRPWDFPALNILLVFKKSWRPGLIYLPSADKETKDGISGIIMELYSRNVDRSLIRILTYPDAINGKSKEEIQRLSLEFLASLYPEDREFLFENFVSLTTFNWADIKPFIPGVTYYYSPDGSLATYGKYLRKNHGRVYFAGSERSIRGLHWMAGAVIRGNEVAADILKEMGRIKSRTEYLREISKKNSAGVDRIRSKNILQILKNFLGKIFPWSSTPNIIRKQSIPSREELSGRSISIAYRQHYLTQSEYKISKQVQKI